MTDKSWRGDRRKPRGNKRGEAAGGGKQALPRTAKKKAAPLKNAGKRKAFVPRLPWIPAKMLTTPLPEPICPYCRAPIKDLACAISDRTGAVIHFDCVRKRIAERDALANGEKVAYLGGGRFGILAAPDPKAKRKFKIKKIIEWEDRAQRAEWRGEIADHFSLT
jgi:hypothetical protein